MSFNKIRLTATLLLTSLLLAGCTIPFLGPKKKAALKVDTTPKATVFINGEHAGQTSYVNENLKEGDIIIKLVPETTSATTANWEGRVKLVSGIMTVVSRNLSALEEEASGYTLTLEPITDKSKSGLTVVTTPDKAIVTVDGEPKGFAPLSLDSFSEGDHEILVSLPGFKEEKMKAKAVNGYKLMATVQLARTAEVEKEATDSAKIENEGKTTPTPTPKGAKGVQPKATPSAQLDRPYVTIISPQIGWVRVRAEASTTAEELIKVNDQESYPLLDTTPNGWYQIEYEKGKKGWISGKYAEKYE